MLRSKVAKNIKLHGIVEQVINVQGVCPDLILCKMWPFFVGAKKNYKEGETASGTEWIWN